MVLTVSFLALALSQTDPSTLFLASVAVVAIGVLLSARCAVGIAGSREIMVGLRARQHRELLAALPEPQHPDTAGRPRSRAPSRSETVA